MKIIALLPVKNEAWILNSYLSSVSTIADEIIVLDDSSTDNSKSLLEATGVTVISYDPKDEKVVDMSARRQQLLEAGREAGGTHFIWLDADETFSSNFILEARKIISALKPGQKINMRWVHLWKDVNHYLDDSHSPFGNVWKDFIVCDNPQNNFTQAFISEARTPGSHLDSTKLPEETGVVLHWQFSRWEITQYKQSLYRCIELLEGSRSAKRINNTYRITLDNSKLKKNKIPKAWMEGIPLPIINKASDINWYNKQIQTLFIKHGIRHFEPLQIWHLPSLRKQFVETVHREPKPELFPNWLVTLNDIKNKLRYG